MTVVLHSGGFDGHLPRKCRSGASRGGPAVLMWLSEPMRLGPALSTPLWDYALGMFLAYLSAYRTVTQISIKQSQEKEFDEDEAPRRPFARPVFRRGRPWYEISYQFL